MINERELREVVRGARAGLELTEASHTDQAYRHLLILVDLAEAVLEGKLLTYEEWTKREEGDDCVMFCAHVKELESELAKYSRDSTLHIMDLEELAKMKIEGEKHDNTKGF